MFDHVRFEPLILVYKQVGGFGRLYMSCRLLAQTSHDHRHVSFRSGCSCQWLKAAPKAVWRGTYKEPPKNSTSTIFGVRNGSSATKCYFFVLKVLNIKPNIRLYWWLPWASQDTLGTWNKHGHFENNKNSESPLLYSNKNYMCFQSLVSKTNYKWKQRLCFTQLVGWLMKYWGCAGGQ